MDIHTLSPVAGKDYPRTWNEFQSWFATEQDCANYLAGLRWPSGFICPACQHLAPPYKATRGRLLCIACKHQTSVTAETIFSKTRTPLKVWLAAAWYLTNQKHGVSALGLQRVLGLGSYQTAWTMLHRFRRAMVRPERTMLSGTVEVDEAYIPINDRQPTVAGVGRKGHTHKVQVIIAVEMLEPKGFGRIRLRRIARDDTDTVTRFVQTMIEAGSVVCTDGLASYRKLKDLGYLHNKIVMLGSDLPAHVTLAGVHRVAALVKRWILGTHHGAVEPDQLDAYLDEFVFRFNRRHSRSRGMLYYRLLQQAVVTDPITYNDIKGNLSRSSS
ncbi:MAG: IS1595 family transposase [Burkholderiales bacterium]|jgi:hypothetical protein